MEPTRFDHMLRSLVQTPSRRRALRLLVSSTLGSLPIVGARPAEAKKRKHTKTVKLCHFGKTIKVSKEKKKKHLRHGDTRGACQPGCTPSCEQKICGDNGCGGSCGTCESGQVCANGRCASSCLGGQKVCAGNCIPNNQCCTGSDCGPDAPRCCRGTCSRCCTEADCPPSAGCLNAVCICPGSAGVPALVQGCCGNADCATGCRCAQINPGAVFACVVDAACPTGVPQCNSNAECGPDAVCNESCGGVCTPLCT